MSLVSALFRVIADQVQTSGNIESRLRALDPDLVLELSDGHVKKGAESWKAFEFGIELGREIDAKTVYRIDIDSDHYFFVGTEAEIIKRIEDAAPLATENPTEELPKEMIDLLEQEIREI